MTKILKALDYLEHIENDNFNMIISSYPAYNGITKYEMFYEIHQALLKAQEQEKVLKIIFEKGLSLAERDMIKYSENYEQYQIKISWWNYKPFAIPKTEEEFYLLKRYICQNE